LRVYGQRKTALYGASERRIFFGKTEKTDKNRNPVMSCVKRQNKEKMPSIKTTIGQREDENRIGFGKECKCQLSNVHGLDYNLSSKKISNPLIDISLISAAKIA